MATIHWADLSALKPNPWDRAAHAAELPELAKLLSKSSSILPSLAPCQSISTRSRRTSRKNPRTQPMALNLGGSTRPGDLWTLGRHRILCGDAGSPQRL